MGDTVKRIYGEEDMVYSGELNVRSNKKHKHIQRDTRSLESEIDQIRKGTGKFGYSGKKSKKPDQDRYAKEMARRRDLPSESSGGVSLGLIMGFVMVGIMLVIGFTIFGSVVETFDNRSMNATMNEIMPTVNPMIEFHNTLTDFMEQFGGSNMIILFMIPVVGMVLVIVRLIS